MKIKPEKTFSKKRSFFLLKSFMFLTCFLIASTVSIYAQTKTISGTVTDVTSEPLIGVSVRIQGTTTGAVTDIDGRYSVSAKEGDVIEFSYVGMKAQFVTVGSQSTINIVLEDDATMLTETVVIGYGSARKRDLTGSIVSVKASEIADRPSSNPLASLQGKIAGVQVVNTGRAGQDPEIRVRGTNSINGYTPLYIVDGLFSDNINYLNPADIESMEILKDPSSLAIFGVRGANGVIIITTKRAKEGQTLVNINSSVGFKHISDRIELTNAAQFKELYNEQLANQGANPFDYTPWTGDTNWQDEIFQTGFITNNNVSITGASEKNRFYMGLGYTSEEGSIKSEKFSKVTVNLNSDYNVTNFLRFGFQVNGSRMLPPDAKSVSGAMRAAPIAPAYGTYTTADGQQEQLLHVLPSFQKAQVWNPLIETETRGRHNIAKNHRVAGNIYGEVDFLKNFKFKTTLSLDYGIDESRTYSPIVWVYSPELNGKENLNEKESVNQSKTTSLVAQTDYILTYDNKFGKHGFTGTAGITTNYREFSSLNGGRSQDFGDIIFSIPNDNQDKWWISALDKTAMTNDGTQWRRFTMSYLLRGLYNYDNRYLFNASYRRDGSSVFRGVNNTWDNFYSFGGGWVITEEEFMKDQKIFDYLKLKGSWGILGSENTGAGYYPSYPGLTSSGGSAVFGDNIVTGYTYEYLVQNLKWEKTHSWEVGLEMNLLNQRLRLEPVYYNKRTKDIIVSLASRSGAQNSLENLGEIENKGFELAASWNDKIKGTDFTYSISANLTTIDNKVISLGRDEGDAKYEGVSRTIAGYPVAYFYGYKVEGVYQNNEDIKQSEPNTLATVKPGDLKFADIDGDGRITTADRTMIGDPTPDFTYGFNISLGYKNFDLSIDMMGVYGNEIYRTWDASEHSQNNYLVDRMNRWNGEGTSNWEPILDRTRSINRMASNYFVEDGSFFRIRNVQLGYTFSPSMLNKIHLKALRLYANIQNLKTWSKNTGYTPEIGGSALKFGVDDGTYPMPAIYTFGVNLTF